MQEHEYATEKVFREGDSRTIVDGKPAEIFTSYQFFNTIRGSAGQGRSAINGSAVSLWTTNSGRKFVAHQGVFVFVKPGDAPDAITLPGAVFAEVGLPSGIAIKSTLMAGLGGVTAADSDGIFLRSGYYDWLPIARTSDAAPGISGATFSSFLDPVYGGPYGEGTAFIATVRGSSVTSADNTGIWFGGRTPLRLLAREGAQPPGAPEGAKWKAFTSLAMPDNTGPIFTATLQRGHGGITSADDTALYGLGSDDILYELLREGQTLLGSKVVQSFNVLTATLGSQGSTRHFTSDGRIIARVTFTDHTSAIVQLSVP